MFAIVRALFEAYGPYISSTRTPRIMVYYFFRIEAAMFLFAHVSVKRTEVRSLVAKRGASALYAHGKTSLVERNNATKRRDSSISKVTTEDI